MLITADALKVADVIVGCVAINVVDVHPRWNDALVMLPNIPVKPLASTGKVFPMRRVVAFRISVVAPTIEDNRLNHHAELFECHGSSPFKMYPLSID
jgi:hypothetical protein